MIVELGHLCLCLAFLVSLLQAFTPLAQRIAAPHPVLHFVKPLATVSFMLTTGAFAALVYAYAVSDFSVLNVALNSTAEQPLIYKLAGAWGNHEGSMLLWAEILSGYGFLVAYLHARDRELKAYALAVLGALSAGFLAFILLTSDPFLRIWPPVADGQDLNPLLQDIGLTFHPPMLYVGYVGFVVVFAYAVAGLLLRRIDNAWARAIRPWLMLPWSALTLGIGAGSWWAYRELGWGGWWFWDPVENVSLLPWLSGTALIHANMVLEKRGQLSRWVVLLAILTFTLALVGTFIVRSGLITSVHAFASDPARGLFILAYIVLACGGALWLYATREFPSAAPVVLLSRSGFIVIGNLLLVSATGVILLAILYPVFLTIANAPTVSVGPDYFNQSFLPLVAPIPLLAALAPLMAWDATSPAYLKKLLRKLWPGAALGVALALAFSMPRLLIGMGSLALAGWMLFGAITYLRRMRRAGATLRSYASFTGHMAIAVFVIGVTLTCLLKQTYEAPIVAKHDITFGNFTLKLTSAVKRQEHNYVTRRAVFEIYENGHDVAELAPELRYYPVRQTQTTEAALYSTPLRDIYVVLGETAGGDGIGVRMYVTPAQQFVWLGFLLAGLSGALALFAALKEKR